MAVYPNNPSWQTLNIWESVGALLFGIGTLVFVINVIVSWKKPIIAGDNPWDAGGLEWFTTSPPPHHNYASLPAIRSERPTWDYHHPDKPAMTVNLRAGSVRVMSCNVPMRPACLKETPSKRTSPD